jgi:hypothetical protein
MVESSTAHQFSCTASGRDENCPGVGPGEAGPFPPRRYLVSNSARASPLSQINECSRVNVAPIRRRQKSTVSPRGAMHTGIMRGRAVPRQVLHRHPTRHDPESSSSRQWISRNRWVSTASMTRRSVGAPSSSRTQSTTRKCFCLSTGETAVHLDIGSFFRLTGLRARPVTVWLRDLRPPDRL